MADLQAKFETLLQQAQQPVLGYLIRLTGSVHAAQDLLQSANVTAMEKRDSFVENTNFNAWLSQIACNHHRNQSRKAATTNSVMLVDDRLHEVIEKRHRERMQQDQQQWNWNQLNHCLDKLPDHQRELVEQFYLHGQSLHDLAVSRNRTRNAIGQALHRARQQLIRCVRSHTNINDAEPNPPLHSLPPQIAEAQ